MCSPALLPPPARGRLYALCGELESEEYHRQNRAIRDAWGAERVPVCEILPGRNHFTALEALAESGNQLQKLALELVFA
jgi:arylformamidase